MNRCCFLIALLCVLLATIVAADAAPPDSTTRLAIGNAIERAKRGHHLTVAYLGGSITEGAGASSERTSWRARTTENLKSLFPDTVVEEVNAAIGGTGSDLGAFRLEQDVLSRHPDLVFVEFAVNDGGAGEERTLRAMEGIVRHLRTADPRCDIVFIYTLHRGMMGDYAASKVPASVLRHQKIAAHYNLPEINVGKTLADRILAAGDNDGTWKRYAPDGVHPNDAGYAVYTEDVLAFLRAHIADKPPAKPARLPKPLTSAPFAEGTIIDAQAALDADPKATGWSKEADSLAGRYPHRIAAVSPDAQLSFSFTGNAIGLYWLIAPDSGDLEWQVDGGPWNRVSSWDTFAKQFTRANYLVLSDSLPHGAHVLHLRTLAEHHPESTGSIVRIGAFLVNH